MSDRHRLRLTVTVTAAALATVVTLAGCQDKPASAPAPSPSASTSPSPSASPTATLPPLAATPAPLPTSATPAPVRVTVPSIGVDSSLDALGLNPDGSLVTPPSFPVAGWYAGGTRPGDPGPAIIAGHIDSYKGPAVFYKLHLLKAGDPVIVTRADGSTLTFTVESSAQYPKSNFPTDAVYGPTPLPEVKLITCTGVFDRSVRSYESNLVVTAVLSP